MISRRAVLQGMAATGVLGLLPGMAGGCALRSKLIEFGWHTPEPAAFVPRLSELEAKLPWDGVVLALRNNNGRQGTQYTLGYNAWRASLERLDYYSNAIAALAQLNAQATK